MAPVALLKTAKDVLTHCTYWVAPAAPFVSGGAPVTEKPGNPTPTPSKLRPGVVLTSGAGATVALAACASGSTHPRGTARGGRISFTGCSRSSPSSAIGGMTGISRSGREMS